MCPASVDRETGARCHPSLPIVADLCVPGRARDAETKMIQDFFLPSLVESSVPLGG